MNKKIITFDMAFSYQMIKERNLYSSIVTRNLDNYFSMVISVHPLAGLFNEGDSQYGHPDIIKINKDHINRVEMSFRSMPSAMLGDHTPDTMGEYFGKGITHKAIISALNYGFHEILVDDLDIDPESQSTPGKGFQAAREKTAKQQKMAKIINLSRGIRILLGTDDKLGHYKDTIEEKFKELQGLITTDQELEVLKMLVKNYPELKDLMEIQSRKKKKTRRRKKKKKQTKRRKKK